MEKEDLAQKVADRLAELDGKLIDLLGIEIVHAEPNRCVNRLVVREDLANSGRVAQGGIIFALADQALAYACMSKNTIGMTLNANITFTRPAHIGDTLTATAEVSFDGGGKTLTGRVVVSNQEEITIAEMSGLWRKIGGEVVDE